MVETMAKNEFDAYREALVMEYETDWPQEYAAWDVKRREAAGKRLHAEPQQAAQLEYVRLHSGFCRKITVTPADVSRLGL